MRELLDFIAQHESNRNYNAYYGKARNQDNPRLTDMTIDEVMQWQAEFTGKHGSPSSAAGRYQIIRKTLRDIHSRAGLGATDVFDEAAQDAMAMALLNRRGLKRFLAGDMSVEGFGRAVAMEWASMPVLAPCRGARTNIQRGQSYYAGDGLNRAGDGIADEFDAILVRLQEPRAEPHDTPAAPEMPRKPVGALTGLVVAVMGVLAAVISKIAGVW